MTPTPEGKQLAADLANAVRVSRGKDSDWAAGHFAENCDDPSAALARLATEHLALKAKHEEALADLREIDALLENIAEVLIYAGSGAAIGWLVS